jgi:hypothetical protein
MAADFHSKVEKEFFEAERALSRIAEKLEDILQAKALIEELDKEK